MEKEAHTTYNPVSHSLPLSLLRPGTTAVLIEWKTNYIWIIDHSWYKRNEFGLRAALFFSAATVSGAFGGLLAVSITS